MISEEKSLEEDKFSPEKRRERLESFRYLKDKLASITDRQEKSQEDFNHYLNSLEIDKQCKHMACVKDIVSLCNNNLFDCKFRSIYNFNFNGNLKFECKREKTLKLRQLL